MKKRSLLHFLGLLLVLAVFAAAACLLAYELRKNDMTFAKIRDSLVQIPLSHIAIALGVTVVNYVIILVGYDYLAFRFAEVPISLARIAFAALVSYPFSYNFGATVAGAPLRYRLYSSWGIPLTKIVQLLLILALTFWFGVFFISGVLFVRWPLHIPHEQLQAISTKLVTEWHIHENVVTWFRFLFSNSRPFGILLLALTALYVGASFFHRGSLKVLRWTLPVPPFRLTLYQIGIASADMLVAASVLHALLPPIHGGYLKVLEVYLVAYVLVVLSHVPGGWGVLEAVMMTLLESLNLVRDPVANMPKVFAAIIVFRVIYFLLPLLFAAVMVGWHEYALRKKWIPAVAADPDGQAEGPARPEGMNGRAGRSGAAEPRRHAPSE
jgi:uncharacterized membrane protein YbhN (UPF0104 family)